MATEIDEVAVRELDLFAENEAKLYPQKLAIAKNLLRKIRKGTYDHSKAPALWLHWYTNAAKEYAKQYSHGRDWNRIFSMATRKHAAQNRADEMLREMKAGEYDFVLTEKNPIAKRGSRSRYKHRKVEPKSHFAKGSFRTVKSGKSRVVVGCPKDKFSKTTGRCKVGTRAVSILTPNPKQDYVVLVKSGKKYGYWNGKKMDTNRANAKRLKKAVALKVAQRYADLNPLYKFGISAIK